MEVADIVEVLSQGILFHQGRGREVGYLLEICIGINSSAI